MRSPLVWAVLLSALTVSLAQPNEWMLTGSALFALFGWVPLFWALRRAPSPRAASGLGALFGLATTLLQNYWLIFFRESGLGAMGAVAVGMALFGALLGPVLHVFLRRRSAWRPFLVGAVWAVFEYGKSNGFLGFPWGLAPYPFHQWPWFIQIVDITGLSFLSFLIISWNAWLAEALEPEGYFWRTSGLFFAFMLVGLAGYGSFRLLEPRPARGSVELALVQQNGDPWSGGDDLGPLAISVRHSREALRDARPDLVVWSETSLRHPLQEWRPYYERLPDDSPLFRTVRANRAWWLFGNPYFQDFDLDNGVRDGVVNAAVLMNPQSQIVDYYGKMQQIPFAEYVPFWDVPAIKAFYQSLGLNGSWDLGRQWTVFHLPVRGSARSLAFATPICFEDAFPWVSATLVRSGAEVLISLTNDSWSQSNSGQWQHHVAALFRAVENRVTLVRSSNAGVTSVIDPTGQISEGPLPSFQDGHLIADVPLPRGRTLTSYTLYGDWLVALFALVVVVELAWTARRRP